MSNNVEMQYVVIGRVCDEDDQIHQLYACDYNDAVAKAEKRIIENSCSFDEAEDVVYIDHVILGKDMMICGNHLES